MKKVVKRLFVFIVNVLGLKDVVLETFLSEDEIVARKTTYQGYLFDKGWYESYKQKRPIDKDGNPIPWLTYPFIDFLKSRLIDGIRLFEYGSGNSTLFYAKTFDKVKSVEINSQWYEYLVTSVPDNVELVLMEEEKSYIESIGHEIFDLIIVDGFKRAKCADRAINNLSDIGVLVIDDSEREEESAICEKLTGQGFKRLDFWGTAAAIQYTKCTSLLYREDNWMNI